MKKKVRFLTLTECIPRYTVSLTQMLNAISLGTTAQLAELTPGYNARLGPISATSAFRR